MKMGMKTRTGRLAKLLMFAAVSGWSGIGYAAGWQEISPDPTSLPISVNFDTIRWTGDLATFSAQLVPPVATRGASNLAIPSSYTVQIACGARQIRLSASSGIDAVNPLAPGDMSPYTFQPVNGTASDVMRRAVCALNPAIAIARIAAENAAADDPKADQRREAPWRPPAFSPQ